MALPFNQTCTHLSLGVCPCPNTKTLAYPIGKRWWGYSTKLMLYDDPWKIKKVLQESDIDETKNMVLLPKDLVEDLVLPVLSVAADADRGAPLKIWDIDTNSMHMLILKRLFYSGSYAFIGTWAQDFVRRRDLKNGDEIGFHWDPYKKHFDFSILVRTTN